MNIITIASILLAASLMTGCDKPVAGNESKPPGPDPVEVLREQVTSERQLREDAVTAAEEEATRKGFWQLLALSLAVITVISFIGGAAIGSRGKRHADTTAEH